MFKKTLALVLACVMVVAVLASCTGAGSQKKGMTEINLFD